MSVHVRKGLAMTQGGHEVVTRNTTEAFAAQCNAPEFFKDTMRARAELRELLDSDAFQGTDACRRFILEYDIRGVGYGTDAFLSDTSPTEWLERLGINLTANEYGIFDENGARDYEQRMLRIYAGLRKRHLMVGVGVPKEADIASWDALLKDWGREYQERYGSHFEHC